MTAINRNPLSVLSDSQIIKRLDALVEKERETTLEVLRHIIEFDRRKLYLGIGYGSLYDYCTLHLGYSESAAMRRIQTSRCAGEFPEILGMLGKNELNLTGVCKLAEILTEENKGELLKEARCKSKRQMEEIVARYKPGKDIKDRVRTIFVKTAPAAANTSGLNASDPGNIDSQGVLSNPDNSKQQNWGKSTTAGGGEKPAASPTPKPFALGSPPARTTILQKKYKLEFTVEPECMKKLEEAKVLLSRKYPDGVPLGTLLEEMVEEYLEKHSPERKKKRREKRRAKQEERKNMKHGKLSQTAEARRAKAKNKRTNKIEAGRSKSRDSTHSKHDGYNIMSRHIPQALQDEVYARDEGRCTFVGPDGMICNSAWNLQIDHVKPYGKGGDHSIDNLRLLCAKHNQYQAMRIFGKAFIDDRVHKKRIRREQSPKRSRRESTRSII